MLLHESVSPAQVKAGVSEGQVGVRDVYIELTGGEIVALRLVSAAEAAHFAAVVRGAATASRLHANEAADKESTSGSIAGGTEGAGGGVGVETAGGGASPEVAAEH